MENTKVCKDCLETKDLSQFYGVQGECKDCTKARVKLREIHKRLDPDWIEKERARHREKYYRLSYKDKHKPTPEKKKQLIKNYKGKYPEKQKAKNNCTHIVVPKGFEKHHWSYNEGYYKDIIPLSIKDHNQLHRFLVYDTKKYIYKCKKSIGVFKAGDFLDTKDKHILYYTTLKLSSLWE